LRRLGRPGFYLCGRAPCAKLYEGKTVEERRVLFTARRKMNRGST
jgi:hypothetical protein